MGVRLGAKKGILESIGEGAREVTLGTRGALSEPCEDAIRSQMMVSGGAVHPDERKKWPQSTNQLAYRRNCRGQIIGVERPLRRG